MTAALMIIIFYRNVNGAIGQEWIEDPLALFRTMQVYNHHYNAIMSRLWSFQVGAAFTIETLAIVLSLKLAPYMPFPTSLMFPSAAICFIWYSTTVYKATSAATDTSEDLVHKFKISADRYERVVGASMKPLR